MVDRDLTNRKAAFFLEARRIAANVAKLPVLVRGHGPALMSAFGGKADTDGLGLLRCKTDPKARFAERIPAVIAPLKTSHSPMLLGAGPHAQASRLYSGILN
jgi:hypothetical protein